MSKLTESLSSLEAIAAALPSDSGPFTTLPDTELLDVPAALARVRRRLDATAAIAAGEIARRSRRELGYAGLAQRSGFHTPAGLLQHVTGDSNREAAKLVRVGVMIHDAEDTRTAAGAADSDGTAGPDGALPAARPGGELAKGWLVAVGEAVASATISVEAAEAIRTGLGDPSDSVTDEILCEAARRLVAAATELNVDQLAIRVRTTRDDLDEAGIAGREAEHRARRSLRVFRQSDGMTRLVWLLDPESAPIVTGTYDALTSPRRGGPRMVDAAEKARAEAISTDDTRTLEQLAHDGFLQLLQIAGAVAPTTVIGTRRPAVRVLVTEHALHEGTGHGRIDGQSDPVSIETVQRHVCDTGILPVAFDTDGQCINVGREQRLFTSRQRIGLSARDGGCLWPDCDRPASWCEAHHINEWHRDRGGTDLAEGVLLCRYHHMLLHNNHWQITRTSATYWLTPPKSHDPTQTPMPMPMPGKSAALGDLQRERERDHPTDDQDRDRDRDQPARTG